MSNTDSVISAIGARSIDEIRADFPFIATEYGRGTSEAIAYLDTAATSQKPASVIETVVSYYREANANVHRALHGLAGEATKRYESARERVAKFIRADTPRSIVFTRGTTESINLVVSSWGGANLESGDVVILSDMEHHANLIPWQLLSRRIGIELRFLEFDENGEFDLSSLDRIWSDRVRMVSLIHVSNVLGSVNDIAFVSDFAHSRGVPVMVDAAQSVPHMPVDVGVLGCDLLAFSGHKMCGPTGIGVLYAREDLLESMPPYMGGGEMVEAAWLDRATWNDIPHKFEAGTPNIAGAVGLGAAIDYLDTLGRDHIHAYLTDLGEYAYRVISALPGVTVYGPATNREAVLSFSLEGIHPHDIAQFLDREGVAVRAGHHCAHPLTRRLGVPATVRASFYVYSTSGEVDRLASGLRKIQEFFHGV